MNTIESYYAIQCLSEIDNEWITELRYNIRFFRTEEAALRKATEDFNKQKIWEDYKTRLIKITEEIIEVKE